MAVQYDRLQKLTKDFQPFRDLWSTASDWLRWHDSWMNDPLSAIDPELLERNVNQAFKSMHKCVKQLKDVSGESLRDLQAPPRGQGPSCCTTGEQQYCRRQPRN